MNEEKGVENEKKAETDVRMSEEKEESKAQAQLAEPIAKEKNVETDVRMSEDKGDSKAQALAEPATKKQKVETGTYGPGSNHPYLGKRVRVLRGKLKGIVGKIKIVKPRGWFSLDHPDVGPDDYASISNCEFIDKVPNDTMLSFIEAHGSGFIPERLRKRSQSAGTSQKRSAKQENPKGNRRVIFQNYDVARERRRTGIAAAVKSVRSRGSVQTSTPLHPAASLRLVDLVRKQAAERQSGIQCATPQMLKNGNTGIRDTTVHPPVLVEPTKDGPSIRRFSHVDAEAKIEVVNRKTGKTLEVKMAELPRALMEHAEYEPIVPSVDATALTHERQQRAAVVREGRSATNVRVSGTVCPQSRFRLSSHAGQSVAVTKGPNRGRIGTIETEMPTGWLVLRGICPDKTELPLIIAPDHIEVLPDAK